MPLQAPTFSTFSSRYEKKKLSTPTLARWIKGTEARANQQQSKKNTYGRGQPILAEVIEDEVESIDSDQPCAKCFPDGGDEKENTQLDETNDANKR